MTKRVIQVFAIIFIFGLLITLPVVSAFSLVDWIKNLFGVNEPQLSAPSQYHPADTNHDLRIVLNELTAYGSGQYATSAGDIYRHGELYTGSSSAQDWIPYHPADTNRDLIITVNEVTAYGSGQYATSASNIWRGGGSYTWSSSLQDWAVYVPAPAVLTVVGTPTSSSVSLSWTAVSGATYRVYRAPGAGFSSATTNSYTDNGLTANTQYTYWVTAVINGVESQSQNSIIVQTAAAGQSYTLTISNSQNIGEGTVTSNIGGINCGATCSASYPSGTSVTLTATAASWSMFSNWVTECYGVGSVCTVTMNSAKTLQVVFNPIYFSLGVTKAGTGTGTVTSSSTSAHNELNDFQIDCGTACTSRIIGFVTGSSVTLTATPASGSTFAGWSGPGAGSCAGTTTQTCTVAMSSSKSVTATFTQSSCTPSWSCTSWGACSGGSQTCNGQWVDANSCGVTYSGSNTRTCTSAPTAPSNLVANTLSNSSIQVSWVDNSNNEDGFSVNRYLTAPISVTYPHVQFNVSAGVTSYVDTGLLPITTYYYTIEAFNSAGSTRYLYHNWNTTFANSVTPGFDFSLNNPSPITLAQGSSGQTSVTATLVSTPVNSVSFSLSTLPSGVTGSFSQTSCNPSCTSTISLNANGVATTVTNTPITVTATGGGKSHTTTFSLTVNPAAVLTCPSNAISQYTNVGQSYTCSCTSAAASSGGTVWGTGIYTWNSPICRAAVHAGKITTSGGTVTYIIAPAQSNFVGSPQNGITTSDFSLLFGAYSFDSIPAGPPPAPTGLTAVAVSSSQINLNWNGVLGIASYKLYRSTDGTTFTDLTSVPVGTNTYSDQNLNSGTTYYYKIASYNVTLVGSQSASVSATTLVSIVPTFKLSVAPTTGGSVFSSPSGISCGSTCYANFSAGTIVSLTASPSSGYIFTGWNGGGCTGTGACSVNMTSEKSVNVNFGQQANSFTLDVNKTGAGSGTVTSVPSINCGPTCRASYSASTIVALTATPASGSLFAGWNGGGCTGTGGCSVNMTSDKLVTAIFNLNTSAGGTNGVCGSTNNACTAGTLNNTADSDIDYLWKCMGINGGANASCSLPKSGDNDCIPSWECDLDWGDCINDVQSRSCTDVNSCESPNTHLETQACTTAGECSDGATQDCDVEDCAGTQTCASGTWGDCIKNDESCGNGGGSQSKVWDYVLYGVIGLIVIVAIVVLIIYLRNKNVAPKPQQRVIPGMQGYRPGGYGQPRLGP